jgi:hypothetical protein
MGSWKKRLKQRAANLFWRLYSLFASVDVVEFQATDEYSSLV